MLPGRSQAEEDAFVSALMLADPDAIAEAVREALRGRRPQLAARLVVMLVQGGDDEELERARKAASLLLVGPEPTEAELDEVEATCLWLRQRRWMRMRSRYRGLSGGWFTGRRRR